MVMEKAKIKGVVFRQPEALLSKRARCTSFRYV
jgi:hypothetical protein